MSNRITRTPLQFESVNNNEYNEDIVNNPASTQHEVAACSRILQAVGDTPSLRKMPTHLIAVQEWKKHVQRNEENFVSYFFQGCESFLIFLHFRFFLLKISNFINFSNLFLKGAWTSANFKKLLVCLIILSKEDVQILMNVCSCPLSPGFFLFICKNPTHLILCQVCEYECEFVAYIVR